MKNLGNLETAKGVAREEEEKMYGLQHVPTNSTGTTSA